MHSGKSSGKTHGRCMPLLTNNGTTHHHHFTNFREGKLIWETLHVDYTDPLEHTPGEWKDILTGVEIVV